MDQTTKLVILKAFLDVLRQTHNKKESLTAEQAVLRILTVAKPMNLKQEEVTEVLAQTLEEMLP